MLAAGFDETTETAFHWRDMYDRLRVNREWTPRELYRIARSYLEEYAEDEGLDQLVLDPMPPVPQLHTKPTPDILEVAIALSRQLAAAYAAARRSERRSKSPAWMSPDAIGSLDELEFAVEPACSCIVLKGWIATPDPIEPPRAIYAIFSGRVVPLARVSRPDVAATYGSQVLDATGFADEISVEDFDPGTYDFHVAAEDAAGRLHVLRPGAVFDVMRPRPGMTLARFQADIP